MKRTEIKTGETYTVAHSEARLTRDPEDGFVVKAMGDPIQMVMPGSDRKTWAVPVESACGADLNFLWHRRWAVKVPGMDGRFLLKLRYIIEPASLLPDRLAAWKAKRQEFTRKRGEAEALRDRIDASGIVKVNFIGNDHIREGYLTMTVKNENVEALIAALNAATTK